MPDSTGIGDYRRLLPVAPRRRAPGFATGAFVGAGLAALLGVLPPNHYSLLFAIAAVTVVVTAVVGASARLPKVASTTPPA